MGSNASVINKEVLKKNITDASTEFLSTDTKLSSIQQDFDQNIKVKMVGGTLECGFSSEQNMNIETRIYNEMFQDSEIDLAQFLKDQASTILSNTVEQTNKGINLAQFNTSIENSSVAQEVISDLSTVISRQIRQEYNNSLNSSQNQDLEFYQVTVECPKDGSPGFSIRQNMNVKAAVENAMKSSDVNNILNESLSVSQVVSESDTIQDNSGFLSGVIMGSIVLAIGLALLLALALGAFKKKNEQEKQTSSYGRRKRRR
jgi:hypothetical protein